MFQETDESLLAEMRLSSVFGHRTTRVILEQAEDFERAFGRGGALVLSKIIDGTAPIE